MTEKEPEDKLPTKGRIEKILKNVLNASGAPEEEKEKWKGWFDKIFFEPREKANSKS